MESTIGGESFAVGPTMETLPTEVLQKILGYLPVKDKIRAERVCKRWKKIATKEIWKDVNILRITTTIESYIVQLVSKMEPRLKNSQQKQLSFRINFYQFENFRSLLSRMGPNIEELEFESCFFGAPNEPVLSIIATHCHNMESIELMVDGLSSIREFSDLLRVNKQLHSFSGRLVENIVEALILKEWKWLSILECWNRTEEMKQCEEELIVLIENSPPLEHLEVYFSTPNILAATTNCKQLKTLAIGKFLGRPVQNYLFLETPLLSNLKVLVIYYYWQYEDPPDDDDHIIALLHHCMNLQELILYYESYSKSLSLEVEEAILALPNLKSFLLRMYPIADGSLWSLIQFRTLGFGPEHTFTTSGLLEMIMNSEYLEELDIPSDKITLEFIKNLVENTTLRKRPKILKVRVPTQVYKEALNVCENSKIHLMDGSDSTGNFFTHSKHLDVNFGP